MNTHDLQEMKTRADITVRDVRTRGVVVPTEQNTQWTITTSSSGDLVFALNGLTRYTFKASGPPRILYHQPLRCDDVTRAIEDVVKNEVIFVHPTLEGRSRKLEAAIMRMSDSLVPWMLGLSDPEKAGEELDNFLRHNPLLSILLPEGIQEAHPSAWSTVVDTLRKFISQRSNVVRTTPGTGEEEEEHDETKANNRRNVEEEEDEVEGWDLNPLDELA